MAITIPEKPLLLYPSVVRELGLDAAVLFSLCYEQIEHAGVPSADGVRSVVLSTQRWQKLTEFWNLSDVPKLIDNLRIKQCLLIQINRAGSVKITELKSPAVAMDAEPVHAAMPTQPEIVEQHVPTNVSSEASGGQPTTRLPVLEEPPYHRRPLPSRNPLKERGPAPTFGGSTGWRKPRETKPQDDLHQIFAQQEEKNQKLHAMYLGWEPSELFYSMLPRHQIPESIVASCLDEFILYYIDKERKETNWDQKFLAWVKREWVQKQTREAREQKREAQSYSGVGHENTRRDTRENRKRVTAAIMDIKDTDW